jgi:putative ABC transport system substrate-binding protein
MRVSRREFVQGMGAVGLALVVGCERLPAQSRARIPRVGILEGAFSMSAPQVQAFVQGLRELGYAEGQNITVEFRSAEAQDERLPALAAELVGIGVDVIVAGGAISIRAALQATETIPVVMLASTDPVSAGFVPNLARPGGNVTGLAYLSADLVPKRLQLLKETVRLVPRIAAIGPALSSPGMAEYQRYEDAAGTLGVELQRVEVQSPDGFERAFAVAKQQGAEAAVLLTMPMNIANQPRLAELAVASQLPAIFDRRTFPEVGGLMAYGANIPRMWHRAAYYVDRIQKGTKPGELPVELAREFEFVVNLRAAQALGLTIPPHVLAQATEVLQ